jgi:antitoxin (DNA-binding transcriptional repressor) of toxin-antitoxin stability system
MDEIVTIHVAKTTLSQLIARVEAGEEIIIARDKSPVARLVPIGRVKAKRQFGALRGKASVDARFFEPLPEDEMKSWE